MGFGLLSFGLASVMVRSVDADPIALVTARTVTAVLFLLPFYWRHHSGYETRFGGRSGLLYAISGCCLGLHFLLWTASLSYTTIASSSILVNLHPVMIIFVERLYFKHKFAWGVWLGVAISFAGSLLLGVSDQAGGIAPAPVLGNVLAALAALCFVVYIIIGRQLRKKTEWLEYVFPVYTWAAVACVVLLIIVQPETHAGWAFWLVAIGLAVGPQLLGHGAMNYAVKYVQPTLLAMTILAEPIISTTAAALIYSEIPSMASLAAMGVVLAGLVLAWFSRMRSEPV